MVALIKKVFRKFFTVSGLVASCALSSMYSCAENVQSIRKLGNWYLVRGVFEVPENLTGEPELYRLNQENQRVPIEFLNWDESTKEFSFKVFDSDFIKSGINPLEANLAMGKEPRTRGKGDLTLAELGIEAFFRMPDESSESGLENLWFAQFRVKYDALSKLAGEQLIELGQLKTKQGSSYRLSLVDENGSQLKEAHVVYIPLSQELIDGNETPWKTLNYPPAIQIANEDGEVRIEPVFNEFPELSLYLVNQAQCHMLSVKILLTAIQNDPSVVFPACEESEYVAGNQSWRAAYDEPERLVLSAEVVDESLGSDPYLYTNEPLANLKIWSTEAETLNPFRVEVYASDETSAEPVISQDYSMFSSKISIDLPVVYVDELGASSTDGRFLIKIVSLGDEQQELNLRGRLKTQLPVANSDLQLQFANQIDGLAMVAGTAENIEVTSSFCEFARDEERAAQKIGLSLGRVISSSNLVTENCPEVGGNVTFSLREIMEAANFATTVGGPVTVRFSLQDAYGNWSEDDRLRNLNTEGLYLDYGRADLQSAPLIFGRDVGLTRSEHSFDSKPKCSFIYPNCVSDASTTEWSIENDDLSFRFSDEESCQSELVQGDGGNEIAARVAKYLLKREDSAPDLAPESPELSLLRSCTELFAMNELDLPQPQAGEELNFYLFVIDPVGNISNSQQINIQPCTATRIAGNICWKN